MRGRWEFTPLAEADGGEAAARHPLAAVEGAATPAGRLRLLLGPKIVGGRYFRLDLEAEDGGGRRRFLTGLANFGRYPGQNWVEVIDLELPAEVGTDPGWELRLAPCLRPLAEAIPAGGHLMIEYETGKWLPTQRALLRGTPALETPMGRLLEALGCAASIKDWYFPEGGQEGPRKLQGNKPLPQRLS